MANLQSEKSIQLPTPHDIPDLVFREAVNVCIVQEESRIMLFQT